MLLKADSHLEGDVADGEADPSAWPGICHAVFSWDIWLQIIHDIGSLCISTMWLFNFFLVEITLKQELQGKETSGKRDQGEFDHHALLHHQAVLHILLIPPHPLHLLIIIILLLFLLLLLLLLLLLQEVWKAYRPSLLSCRDL